MRIDILTLFPEMFSAYLNESILKRAQDSGRVSIHLHNIRDYTTDKHHIRLEYFHTSSLRVRYFQPRSSFKNACRD